MRSAMKVKYNKKIPMQMEVNNNGRGICGLESTTLRKSGRSLDQKMETKNDVNEGERMGYLQMKCKEKQAFSKLIAIFPSKLE